MGSEKGRTDHKANRTIFRRTLVLMILFGVALFFPLIGKLWDVQINGNDRYTELALKQQTRDVSVSANRGAIYDCNGEVMAISGTVQSVIMSPRDVLALVKEEDYDNKTEYEAAVQLKYQVIADGLSEILGADREKILTRLQKTKSAYEVLATKVEDDTAEQVRQFIRDNKLSNGVYLTPDTKRYYPYASLASQVIGFTNSEGDGAYGIEAVYNSALDGEDGRVITAKNATGTEMLSNYENYIDAKDGQNLYLTIDSTIQYYAERTLQEGIERYEARNGGFCIVMNPKTAAIYAMASSPGYDLNDPRAITDETVRQKLDELAATAGTDSEEYLSALQDAQYAQWRNKCLNDSYEPGSTFKTLVLAAALEEGAVTEENTYFCSGSVGVAGWTISCSKHDGHGQENLRQAVMNSCNPAFIKIGQQLGAKKFYQYMKEFGLMDSTGIDLQGEGGSIIWSEDEFTAETGLASLATASFGQRLQVTPIQMVTAASAAVNGGYLMEPYVVQRVTDSDGNLVEEHDPVLVRQVISESTSAQVCSILESVVGDGGTGKNAYVAGYRIGGKTGTSETLRGLDDYLIVSFLGIAPADDPEIVVLLAYDSPTPVVPGADYTSSGVYISGGNMAAPMAGELIANILDYMGIEKQYTQEELAGSDTLVPKLIGSTEDSARSRLKKAGFGCRTVGTGTAVTDQIPAAGATIPGGSDVILYLGEPKPADLVKVPDVSGKTPTAVRNQLEELGLYLRAVGGSSYYTAQTVAASQTITPGTEVERGTVVEVRFIDNSVSDYAKN